MAGCVLLLVSHAGGRLFVDRPKRKPTLPNSNLTVDESLGPREEEQYDICEPRFVDRFSLIYEHLKIWVFQFAYYLTAKAAGWDLIET